MSGKALTVLVVGATGSIGRLVVNEAMRRGHSVRALVRETKRARDLPAQAECVVGDLTKPATLVAAVGGIDAIVFTHGGDGGGKAAAEQVSPMSFLAMPIGGWPTCRDIWRRSR